LTPVAERFLRYVAINTQSDPESKSVPSTACQLDLSRILHDELVAMGTPHCHLDGNGYVYATIPASHGVRRDDASLPVVGLLAHVDTSPDAPGADVLPLVHFEYSGGRIVLPGNPDVTLDPVNQPALLDHIGEDVITSDGTTLLGSDDKAGVAVLMQLAEDLLTDRSIPRPAIRLCFTVDEEIGRGVDHLDLDLFGADVAYTLDGSGVDTINAETFNAVEAVVHVTGVSVHPGYARGRLVNAIKVAALFLAELPADRAPETTDGRQGFIHPVHMAESDCAGAEIKLILRDFEEQGIQEQKALLEAIAEATEKRCPNSRVRVTFREQYRNMREVLDRHPAVVDHIEVETLYCFIHQLGINGGRIT